MSLDKGIQHGKEKRRPFWGAKSLANGCRSHGSCPRCRDGRAHKHKRRAPIVEAAR